MACDLYIVLICGYLHVSKSGISLILKKLREPMMDLLSKLMLLLTSY